MKSSRWALSVRKLGAQLGRTVLARRRRAVLISAAALCLVTIAIGGAEPPWLPTVGSGVPVDQPTDGPAWRAFVDATAGTDPLADYSADEDWFTPVGLEPLLPEQYLGDAGIIPASDDLGPSGPAGTTPSYEHEAVPLPLPSEDVVPTPYEEYRESVGPSGRPFPPSAEVPPEPEISPAGVDVPLGGNANEPTVAVNPLNALNIAAANNGGERVSINGGATWSAILIPPMPAGYVWAGDPSLAFDSQGRLFLAHLGFFVANGGLDVMVTRINPATGAVIAGPFRVSTTGQTNALGNDKEWLAADRFIGSGFQDRLYCSWTEFNPGGTRVLTSFSSNQGVNWSVPLQLGTSAIEGFVWPTHNAVAPNGDVYVAYHAQPTFVGGAPDGVSGRIWVCRSTNGGVTFPQKNNAFAAGAADMTFNVQTSANGKIAGTQFWLQGSVQPWVLPDPTHNGHVYVVANDDPDNNVNAGDPANVYIARSTNFGVAWGAPARVDGGPGTTFQVMPTAAIDDDTGCIAVHWYDNRRGTKNANNRFLLDVNYTVSRDSGVTFGNDGQINDATFDPDLGAPVRFPGPPPTTRIGEYNGVAMAAGDVFAVWTGNTVNGQQMMFDTARCECGRAGKYAQLIDCGATNLVSYFSNLNSNVNPFIRMEEFVCPETGYINEVTFWGDGWNVSTNQRCDPATNVDSIQIDLFEWQTAPNCQWTKGALLCSNRIPFAQIGKVLECDGALGVKHTKFTARLPKPCFQKQGTRYVIQIAAVLTNPANPCIFAWSVTGKVRGFPAVSVNRTTGAVSCVPEQDMAFELANRERGFDKYTQRVNCNTGCYYSNLNNNTNPYLRIDDWICNFTGTITQIGFWAGGWDNSRGIHCDLASFCDTLQIDIFQWVAGGPCGFQTGALVCSNQVRVASLDCDFACDGPNGERVFRYVANLPNPCVQKKGQHLVLRVAAISRDPNDPCLFCWQPTPVVVNSPAYSINRTTGACVSISPDMAFWIHTTGKKGDLNCDGVLNNFDIDAFVLALTNPAGYAQQYPDCDRLLADMNGDGVVNNFDIDPFVACLTNPANCP